MEKEKIQELRFKFGKNWKNYSYLIDEDRIKIGEGALKSFLGNNLIGKTFIDVGCGSGIHSLCAKRLKAAKVYSFDYDLDSVQCTESLKNKYDYNDPNWEIKRGSILDKKFLSELGLFDIVYSWGVLHHTGDMWQAIENTMQLTKEEGLCFIAIYNDQGFKSKFWWIIKCTYNKLPNPVKKPYALFVGSFFQALNIVKYTILLKPMTAIKPLLSYKKGRGMSWIHDIIDWVGGFPYEFATIEKMSTFFSERGFELVKYIEAKSLGCHQIMFKKIS